ncbi:MAG: putative peptidoglycan glycosyltransferase FtsW [Alphaproteobacteria bacterium]
MIALTRADESVFGRWWWTIDRWMLAFIAALIMFGIILIQAASPAIAVARGFSNFHFVHYYLIVLIPALVGMIALSMQSLRTIRLVAFALLPLSLLGVAMTLAFGAEIKGATRWLHFPGLSLQPSEFVKPALTIVAAWLFARHCERRGFPGIGVNILLFGGVIGMLLLQPDFGMSMLIAAVWFGQFFLAGLPLALVGISIVLVLAGGIGAYFVFPHVHHRINRFLDPASGDNYQVERAMEAFTNGGLFGTGPGEGTVKMSLPDAHCDFIFAVAGEELGLVSCLIIVLLFAMIVLRGFWRLRREQNLFVVLAASGLLLQFGFQAVINMASTLRLMPTKGMTLPFISYGGSSLLALAVTMGMLLALTRRRYGPGES